MALTKVSFSMIQGAYLNVLDFGAKGDGSTDDTVAIQAGIDAAAGENVLYFPAGTYRVTDTLLLKNGTAIVGSNEVATDYRATGSGNTFINLDSADNPNTILFDVDQTTKPSGYIWCIAIKNISLSGQTGDYGQVGINLNNVANSLIENVYIQKFGYGIYVTNGQQITYNQVNASLCGTSSFYISANGNATTTQTFNGCVARESDWGWIIPSDATSYSINTILNDCLIESTKLGGISLHKSCSATFNNMYCENVPDDRVTTNGDMFHLFKDGDNTVSPYNSYAIFNNGDLSGGNFSLFSGSTAINVGFANYVSINNCKISRATYGIQCDSTNTKADSVHLANPQFVQITTPYYNTSHKINGTYPDTIGTIANVTYGSFAWLGVGQTQKTDGQCARFQSTTEGVGLPQQTTAQRTNYSPPAGTLVFDTDAQKAYVFTTGGWSALN